ncbi:Protein of unknown function DUF3425 [Phaffia rhodozyma]|uniref:BZIP domain-containing protein n=1 Tax=Phaffia rhodozyma TaxID=264483 RepID=A0A0F7SM62_PHARH|nr:Protein of unknown function DUF3425 [Phaffia rhodozyma]
MTEPSPFGPGFSNMIGLEIRSRHASRLSARVVAEAAGLRRNASGFSRPPGMASGPARVPRSPSIHIHKYLYTQHTHIRFDQKDTEFFLLQLSDYLPLLLVQVTSDSSMKPKQAPTAQDDPLNEESEEEDYDEASGSTEKTSADKKKESENSSTRKAQNRIAQREFRQRKQQYIRELETRVEVLSANSDHRFSHLKDVIQALMDENQQLRQMCSNMGTFFAEGLGSALPRIGMTPEMYDAVITRGNSDTALDAYVISKERLQKQEPASPAVHDSPSEASTHSPSQTNSQNPKRKRGSMVEEDISRKRKLLYENALKVGSRPVARSKESDSWSPVVEGSSDGRQPTTDLPALDSPADGPSSSSFRPTNVFHTKTFTERAMTTPFDSNLAGDPNANKDHSESSDANLSRPNFATNTAPTSQIGLRPLLPYPPPFPNSGHNTTSQHTSYIPSTLNVEGAMFGSHESSGSSSVSQELISFISSPSPSTTAQYPGAQTNHQHQRHQQQNLPPITGMNPPGMIPAGSGSLPDGRSSLEFNTLFNSIGFPTSNLGIPIGSGDGGDGGRDSRNSLGGGDVRSRPTDLGGPLARNNIGGRIGASAGKSSGSRLGGEGNRPENFAGVKTAKQGDALALIGYHLTNYRKNPSYHLPPSLVPTYLQQTVPHSHMIDGIPIAELRDTMIQFKDQYDLGEALSELCEDVEIHGQDALSGDSWEIPELWMRKYPMLINEQILSGANRWRSRRGDPIIAMADLKVSVLE